MYKPKEILPKKSKKAFSKLIIGLELLIWFASKKELIYADCHILHAQIVQFLSVHCHGISVKPSDFSRDLCSALFGFYQSYQFLVRYCFHPSRCQLTLRT